MKTVSKAMWRQGPCDTQVVPSAAYLRSGFGCIAKPQSHLASLNTEERPPG